MPERTKNLKEPARKSRKPLESPRLTRDDWLDAAFLAVVEGGFDKARVLTIADALGVTRGSFYWHFTDHADLLAALLARWKEREIELDKSLRPDVSKDPVVELERLLEKWTLFSTTSSSDLTAAVWTEVSPPALACAEVCVILLFHQLRNVFYYAP